MSEAIREILDKVKKTENILLEVSNDAYIDDKGIIIDETKKIIIIPIKNISRQVHGYGIASFQDKDKLSQIKLRMRNTDRTLESSSIKGPLAAHLLGVTVGKTQEVFFKNGCRMDIRRENVKIISKGEAVKRRNAKNGKKDKHSSLFKGVTADKKISVTGEEYFSYRAVYSSKFVGHYQDEIDAAMAYDLIAVYTEGKDAICNDLLSEKMIRDIVKNGLPDSYASFGKKKERELPTYISKTKGKTATKYKYNFKKYGRICQGTFDTLDEAIKGLAERLALVEEEERQRNDKGKEEAYESGEEDEEREEPEDQEEKQEQEEILQTQNDGMEEVIEPANEGMEEVTEPKSEKEILYEELEKVKTIIYAKYLQEFIKKKKWHGKNGYFQIKDVTKPNFETCKNKVIELLQKSIDGTISAPAKRPNGTKPVLLFPILEEIRNTRKIIRNELNDEIVILHEGDITINFTKNTLKMPIRNSKKATVGYYETDLDQFDKLRNFSSHLKTDKHGYQTVFSGTKGYAIAYLILDKEPDSKMLIEYRDKNCFNLRKENICLIPVEAKLHLAKKKEGKFSSNYKGVTVSKKKKKRREKDENGEERTVEEEVIKYRATISHNDKYIGIGSFDTELEAAKAYDIYSIHLYRQHTSPNNLLTKEEMDYILENGLPSHLIKNENIRDLPKNIYRQGDKYFYQFTREKVIHRSGLFDTQDACLAAKEAKLQELKNIEEQKEREKIITIPIDENGEAYIILHDFAGNVKGKAYVDKHVWEETNKYKWHLSDDRHVYGEPHGKRTAIQNFLYETFVGEIPEGLLVDHINRNPLWNLLNNLRLADNSLQNHNTSKREGSILQYKGITTNGNKFVVNPYGERFSFEFLEDAIRKFNELAKARYGDQANQYPDPGPAKTRVIDTIGEVTEEYINSIKHLELFKTLVKKMKWQVKGGSGDFKQEELKMKNLDTLKKRAIGLLRKQTQK